VHLRYDPEADAAYVYLRDAAHVDRTEALPKDRLIDYMLDEPIGIELLNVSAGVAMDGLPRADEVSHLLQEVLGMRIVAVPPAAGLPQELLGYAANGDGGWSATVSEPVPESQTRP